MDAFQLLVLALCGAGVLAGTGALRALARARDEFQSRLRNAAMSQAHRRLLAAMAAWAVAGVLAATTTPDVATAEPTPPAHVRPLAPAQPPVSLRLDPRLRPAPR